MTAVLAVTTTRTGLRAPAHAVLVQKHEPFPTHAQTLLVWNQSHVSITKDFTTNGAYGQDVLQHVAVDSKQDVKPILVVLKIMFKKSRVTFTLVGTAHGVSGALAMSLAEEAQLSAREFMTVQVR